MVEPEGFCLSRVSHLAQRCDVVENPEGASVRRDHQVVTVDREIANRTDRQIELQRLPVLTVVERDISSEFGSGEEQPPALRIFPNRAQEGWSGNAVRDRLPGSAIVSRSIKIRRAIVEAAAIYGCICDCR